MTQKPLETNQMLDSSLDDSQIIDWVIQNGRSLLIAFGGILLTIILIYRFSGSSASNSELDYYDADRLFGQIMQSTDLPKDDLAQLQNLINRHPELHAKYDGLLAQALLDHRMTAEALPFATSALERTAKENRPFYHEYAQTTLLIAQQQYQEALQQTDKLQQQFTEYLSAKKPLEGAFEPALLAYNLLRTAALQQQLGLTKEELQTWQQWQKYANQDRFAAAFADLLEHLTVGKVALTEYIAMRVQKLKV